MDNWANFFDWASKAFLGGVCVYGVNVLSQMKTSIDALNETMAQIVERTEWHSRELEKLEERLQQVEQRT